MRPARKGIRQGWTVKPPARAGGVASELSRQLPAHVGSFASGRYGSALTCSGRCEISSSVVMIAARNSCIDSTPLCISRNTSLFEGLGGGPGPEEPCRLLGASAVPALH